MANYAKVRLDDLDNLELSTGKVLQGSGPHELKLRHSKDPAVLEAYQEGRVTIIDGGEWLIERADDYDYSDTHWRTLKNGILEGVYDEDLEIILEHDDRDSVLTAANERLESL